MLKQPVQPGGWRDGPDRDPAERGPAGREAGGRAEAPPGAINGVVWRDFKPGGGKPGKVETGELGLPG